MRTVFGLVLLGVAAGTSIAAFAKDASAETAIPFVSSLGSIEWKAISKDTLYIRGGTREWYRVRTMNRCTRLRSALAIGFETSALNQLDRHGAILVEGVRCPVESLTRSESPPPRKERHKTR